MANHLEASPKNPNMDWDPRAMLRNLSFLEQKIHQVKEIVRSIVDNQYGQLSIQPNEVMTADLSFILVQLISTASTLLPSMKNTFISSNPSFGQLGDVIDSSTSLGLNSIANNNNSTRTFEYNELIKNPINIEDHGVKDGEDGVDGENHPLGSYEVLQLEKEEILAPHTHFCSMCGKGFKRDANLRMHMRGHGDEYKTPAALAKPVKELSLEPMLRKRYSCPFVGCKRNKEHQKFQSLKTILCVKNHYKRSHCDKSYTCSRCCSKKFSVMADLKTHEKHCGRDKWICSCGTMFSRKDKLFGHVALFQGHTPAIPTDETKGLINEMANTEYNNNTEIENSMDDINVVDIKGVEEDCACFSPMNFNSCNFEVFDEFAAQFDAAG